jgi:hypothetical protein
VTPWLAALRTEVRARRVALLATAGAVAAGVVLLHLAHPGGRVGGDAREAVPAAGAGLAFLVLGLDLFARDGTGSAWALVLRTPAAFRAVFLARTTAFLLAGAAAALLAFATDAGMSAVRPPPPSPQGAAAIAESPPPRSPDARFAWREASRLREGGPLSPPRTAALLAIALAAGLWLAIGSTWTPSGGAASFAGPFALALLAAPFLALHATSGYVVGTRRSDVVALALLAAALGTVVLVVSYGLGRRFLARGRPGLLAGAAIAAAASLGGAGALAARAASWVQFDLDDPDVRVTGGYLGEGGRHLYVTAHRGRTWWPGQGFPLDFTEPAREGPGSPPRSFAIDLETQTARPIGALGDAVAPPVEGSTRWAPLPWLVVGREFENDRIFRWVDARTAEVRLVSRRRGVPPEAVGWAREVARNASPHRDAAGRRVWALFGRREVEGESAQAAPPSFEPVRHVPVPGGWRVSESGRDSFLSAETGERRSLAEVPTGADWVSWQEVPIGPVTSLVRGSGDSPGGKPFLGPWTLVDRAQVTSRPAGLAPGDEVLLPLLDGRVLVHEAATGLLFLYEPTSERRTPVAVVGVSHPVARTAWSQWRGHGSAVFGAHPHSDPWPMTWVRLDPASATIRPLSPPITRTAWSPVAVEDDDSVVVVEDERTVVRYGPDPAARTVLWPKAAKP